MDRSSSIRQHHAAGARSSLRRARASIDLRSHGAALAAIARSRHVPLAVVVRTALAEWLASRAGAETAAVDAYPAPVAMPGGTVKVTLRMPARHAAKLARVARAAEVSQGFYVAQLMDGLPPRPVSLDLRESRRALLNSTTQLAALCGDLRALERGLRAPGRVGLAACAAAIEPLPDAVHRHLAVASAVLAEVAGPRRPPVRGSDSA